MFSYKYLILLSVVVLVFLFGSGIVTPLGLFDIVLLQPILNLLFLLSKYLFDSIVAKRNNYDFAVLSLKRIIYFN